MPADLPSPPGRLRLGGPPRSVTVRVPAKLNLHLGVGARRDDGYHELCTVFHAVGLLDTITVVPAERMSIAVTGEGADAVPQDADNLAWKAATLLARKYRRGAAVAIRVEKSIPVAAGLAGGSADAAATLLACDALWGLDLSPAVLHRHAATLGSDVAFCLEGGTAIGTGRGERIAPVVTARSPLWWVLAIADHGLSTAAVYAELDRLRPVAALEPRPPEALLRALRSGEPDEVGAQLHNDLQDAACSLDASLSRVLDAGAGQGALRGVVAGSGATVAFLTRDAEHAAALAGGLEAAGVCRTTRVTTGAVPGARVV